MSITLNIVGLMMISDLINSFINPFLLFGIGFIFWKLICSILISIFLSIGSLLLYLITIFFFKNLVHKKLGNRMVFLKELFNKNEFLYFTLFRLGGGGGIPYAIQNVLPVLFNISIKNYFLGTFIGSWPTMFISVALGAGVEKYIETNEKLSLINISL